ncbi:MAG: helix-turn-helix domain-containing protein [Oscillospiraceae bacterium]|jgi:Mrp family chromosome partitioning ATPase|nr:helix-turn-helix domain-containing protein [Oscillospiraceae bacterium]
MAKQKYEIKLTKEERKQLQRTAKSAAKSVNEELRKRAKAILCLDVYGGKSLTVEQTAKKCKLHPETVYKIRKEYVLKGLEQTTTRKKRETPPVPPKITGDVEAHIIAIACSTPPEGKSRWTLQMIADKIVLDGHLESVSDVAIMKTLKKLNLSLI